MNNKNKKYSFSMKKIFKGALASSILGALVSTSSMANFVHTDGKTILDEQGQKLFLSGINLGNWLLWEGYLMMGDFNYRTHSQFLESLTTVFGSEARAKEFEHQWRLNYVDNTAIAELSALGFNSVRVPFHYNMFWQNNQLSDHGFQYFDQLIDAARDHGMYVLLDMHAAPGYQNPGDHADNVNSNASQPRDTVTFWDGTENIETAAKVWKHIAQYYKDEPVIWGYDLFNEPVPQEGREMELLPSLIKIRDAIREVDNNHIIVAEGSWWSSDLTKIDWSDPLVQAATGVNSQWDDNLVYQIHHYGPAADNYGREAITNNLNIPLIIGEYGESDYGNLKLITEWAKQETSGYFPWSFKKMSHDKTLWTIKPNQDYNEMKNHIVNNTRGSDNLYSAMIDFAQNNIRNGAPHLEWDQGFFNAIDPGTVPPPPPPPAPVCDDEDDSTTLPGKVQAESHCASEGIQLEQSADTDGTENVGWLDAGDWLEFKVNVAAAGEYTLVSRVASQLGSAGFEVKANDQTLANVAVPATGDWQLWESLITPIQLDAGEQILRLDVVGSGFNLNWLELIEEYIPPVPACESATATGLPARVEAEDYCDMKGIQTEQTQDVDGELNIGWVNPGDWVDYKVNVATAGDYELNLRVASKDGSAVEVLLGDSQLANFDVASTGDWQNWQTVTQTVSLPQGENTLRLNFAQAGININWLEVAVAGVPPIDPPIDPPSDVISDGTYRLISRVSGKALDVSGVSFSDGANVHQWTYGGGANQHWLVQSNGSGQFEIVSQNSGKCLDADSNSLNVQQWACFGNVNQTWTIELVSEGFYRVINNANNQVLSVSGAVNDDGANVQVLNDNGWHRQQWQLIQLNP